MKQWNGQKNPIFIQKLSILMHEEFGPLKSLLRSAFEHTSFPG